MNFDQAMPYLLSVVIITFFIWRKYKMNQVRKELPRLFEQGAQIVDVRSPAEYAIGSSPKSVNIPLDQLSKRIKELDRNKPVVLCCASGARSGMAADVLRSQGFEKIFNAGAWSNTL